MYSDPDRLRELTRDAALRKLGSVPMGRIAFTRDALPVIRPVNHMMLDGDVVLRCKGGSALLLAATQIVAFAVDEIEPEQLVGWSVMVTGRLELVANPAAANHYRRMLSPWFDDADHHVLRIHPEIITGYETIGQRPATCQPAELLGTPLNPSP
jgi:nitroimidazol reductase NimA-like FMN-containing flavoprotein (pyridoxamine 5'-phosphate oxidase superfamily)